MYGETNPTVDPYSDAYNAPPAPEAPERDAPRGRSRSRSPVRRETTSGPNGPNGDSGRYRSPPPRRRTPPPSRRSGAIKAPIPSSVLGVFGLSIRTQERDLEDEFSRYGQVVKVTIVYDQRSDRSRGFGFIEMGTVEEAGKCIQELNGMELNGRKIRVDYSVTDRPHNPTPGEYMGHRRARDRDDRRDHRDSYRGGDSHRDRRDRDRDRDNYGRDRDRDWRDRRSPPPRSSRYSPEYSSRRRRSYSRSPPPRGSSPPPRKSNGDRRDYDASPPAANGTSERW